MLFPVTALLFWRLRQLPRWLLGAVAVLVMAPEAYLCLTTGSPYFPFSWMSRILTGFTAGVLVYLVVRDIPRTERVQRVATWLSWLVVALILGGLVLGNWLGPAPDGTERGGLVLVLFPPLVGVLALAGSRGIGRMFATRPSVHGGRISYSLYLIHVPVFEILWTAMERIGVMHDDGTLATALTPIAFALVFVLADLLHRLIEEPARRALRRR